MNKNILEIKNLETSFYTHVGEVKAVRDNSFQMKEGDILGIVGESGSGKSVTALSIISLIDKPGKIKQGSIKFEGKELVGISNKQLHDLRGNEIAMIFQDPMTSLNPVFTIEHQMVDVIRTHTKMTKAQAKFKAVDMLKLVGIPEAENRISSYPHEFSGGMRQRVMIAMALSCNPKLLIADEPTTALDVTIQAQILDLLKELKKKLNMSIIIITHDLGVIAEICTDIVVMYGGTIVEKGTVDEIFYDPRHPYTMGLYQSIPSLDIKSSEKLIPIKGTPPDLIHPPKGCPFSPRCNYAMEICNEKNSPLFRVSQTHTASCWLMHHDAPQLIEGYKKGELINVKQL